MYIAMNRFQVAPGSEETFEDVWRGRANRLGEMKGYVSFNLLRGPSDETHTLYASHTIWESEEDFVAWTKSEQFREAHKNAGAHKTVYLGPPKFEGFTSIDGI
ncbi:MAG: antibiotic biosynthesis monooxygenase [Pseudomonadota bacterium]